MFEQSAIITAKTMQWLFWDLIPCNEIAYVTAKKVNNNRNEKYSVNLIRYITQMTLCFWQIPKVS